jgi:hypothetical protein
MGVLENFSGKLLPGKLRKIGPGKLWSGKLLWKIALENCSGKLLWKIAENFWKSGNPLLEILPEILFPEILHQAKS